MTNNTAERTYKFLNIASSIVLSIAVLFIIIFSWLLFIDDNPPLVVNSIPVLLDKDTYFPGDDMKVTADVCRNTSAGATLYPTFINTGTGQLFDTTPIFVDNLPMGCSVSTITVTVPHYLPPGIYVRRVRARYQVNFIATRVVEFYTEDFEILEMPAS